MSSIEVNHQQLFTGWFCQNDLFLHCHREECLTNELFEMIVDNSIRRHRYIPHVDFTDEKLFPKIPRITTRKNFDDDNLRAELNSMLAGREYIRKGRLDHHKRRRVYRFHD